MSEPKQSPFAGRWLVLRVLGPVAVAVLLAALWLLWNYQDLLAWKQEAGALPFFALMAVLPLLGVPMTPFFVLAGAMFGAVTGLIGSAVALAVNLLLGHWVAHSALRPYLTRFLQQRTRYRLPDLGADVQDAVRFTVLVRLAPGVPLFLKNYVLGLAGIPLRSYFWLSMLLTGVYGVGFVLLGESMLAHNLAEAALAVALLGAAGFALYRWRRRTGRDGRQRDARQDESGP
jgi:uncharacterized membrane protein YdjX (TVP38/TMEM64 family)